MKINKFLFRLLRYSGLVFLFREFIQRRKVTILLFHDIQPKSAELAFTYLNRKYNIIDLNLFVNKIYSKSKIQLPPKSLIITFDDGHIGNYKLLPLVKQMNIPVTIFLCSSIIGSKRQFWFKIEDFRKSKEKLKKLPNQKRLGILSKKGYDQEKEYDVPNALQRQHVDEMRGYFNFQSHTMFHPILTTCTNSEAKSEIFQSKDDLENKYGLNINAIAYPNGNYDEREVMLSKEAGYKCGLTVDFGFNDENTDPFRLKRLSVNDTSDMNELSVKASGLWQALKNLVGANSEQ